MSRRLEANAAPDWTDPNQHDPGVTLVQLLPWVAGALSFALGIYLRRRRRVRD